MRLHRTLLAPIAVFLAWNCFDPTTNAQVVAQDLSDKAFAANINALRSLRSQKSSTSEDDPIINEETRNTMNTQLFPAWYAAGKTPEDAFEELKNPSIGDENWPIYKNYKMYYDTYKTMG